MNKALENVKNCNRYFVIMYLILVKYYSKNIMKIILKWNQSWVWAKCTTKLVTGQSYTKSGYLDHRKWWLGYPLKIES